MSTFTFQTPPIIHFGWGMLARLPAEAAARAGRPLVVAGRSASSAGRMEYVLALLRGAGLEPSGYAEVPPEPGVADVQACMEAVQRTSADGIIGIGGGSVMDVAKAAAALAGTGHSAEEYFRGQAVPERGLPIILLPTTAGTGSEVTWVSVLVERSTRRKASIRGPGMMPHVAIVDPELTVTCPAHVTAHSGMDAWVQAVESFTSAGANPLTEALARRSAHLIATHLPRAVAEPECREAREAMALGSMMAGMALNTSRLGLVHGLAHPIGAVTGAAHGLLCGLLMPAVMRFNMPVSGGRYAELARDLVLGPPDGDDAEAAAALLQWVEQTLMELGIPRRLAEVGYSSSEDEWVARETMPSGSTKANPRRVTLEDARQVIAQA